MEIKQKPSELDMLKTLLFGEIDSEEKRLKVCLISTFLFGLMAHAYGLLNIIISHDSLHEFYWTVSRDWKFTLGRFMEPLLRFLMGEIITLPWLTGLAGLLFVALAVHLLSKMFALNTMGENILLSGICITNMTVTALIATYLHDFAGDMLALLLSVAAAWAWLKMEKGFSWKYTILGALCLTASFGFYQAYLAVMATALLIYAILSLLRGASVRDTVWHLLRALPMVVLALGGYALCVVATQRLFHVSASTGGKGNDLTQIGTYLQELEYMFFKSYRQVRRELFTTDDWECIKGVHDQGNLFVNMINVALLAYSLWVLLGAVKRKKVAGPAFAMIAALLAVLPLAVSCVSIVSTTIHGLVRYAVYLFYLLVMVITREGQEKPSVKKWRQAVVFALIAMVIFSNVQLSNIAYEKKDLEYQATLSTMTRVLSRVEESEGYVQGESEVAIIGSVMEHQSPLELGLIRGAIGLYNTSPITNLNALHDYFEIVLQYPIRFAPYGKQTEIMESEEFRAMPTFPDDGCVQTIDGVIVVKMSEKMA